MHSSNPNLTVKAYLTKLSRAINKVVKVIAFKNRYESAKYLYNYYKHLTLEINTK